MSSRLRSAKTIVHAWLHMDFFGDPRHDGGSALTSTIFSQSFLAFVLAVLLFDSESQPVPYMAANLSLSTLFVGIGALADPQRALHRRRADDALLRPAPLPRGAIQLARGLHGTFYIVLITTGMAIPPAIFAYWVQGSLAVVPLYIACACLLAGIGAGAIALGLRIAERTVGRGPAMLLAGTSRAVLLGGGFVAFALCLSRLGGTADDLPLGRAGAWTWPPYHAARWLSDYADFTALAALLGTTIIIFGLDLVIPEADVANAARRRPRRFDPIAAIEHRLAGSGPLLGATRFVATMLYRSPAFRARVLPLVGMPIAMTVLSFVDADERGRRLLLGMTMQFPAIYLPFLIAFLPNAEQAGSGQVFATSPHHQLGLARESSLIALTTRVLTPLLALAAALAFATGDSPLALLALTLFSWGTAVLITTIQLGDLPAMPFTLDGEEQQDGDFGKLMGGGLVLAVLGGAFAIYSDQPLVMALGLVVAIIAARRLSRAPHHARSIAPSH